jgi:16S rRNA (uracil1498-N3)-methyltransferase
MPRFYLPPSECKEPTLFLTGSEAHHAVRVLRVRQNDSVTVLDGAGSELHCAVVGYDRDKVQLKIIEKLQIPPLPWNITLLQALPKGKIFESIIQKATELGVFRIIPVLSERVVSSITTQRERSAKAEKWRTIAIEAIKQCGSAWLPQIELPTTPSEFLQRGENFDIPLIASLQQGSRHPRECFRAFREKYHRPPRSLCIWVGPEGDFTPQEVELITSARYFPISLGRLVLRVETAATYCLSILTYEALSDSENSQAS